MMLEEEDERWREKEVWQEGQPDARPICYLKN